MKFILPVLLFLSSPLMALDVERSAASGDFAATYVLRNPYYDGSQSVTVASATVTGPSFSVGGSTLVVSAGKVGVGGTPSFPLQVNYIGATAGSISVNNVLQLQSDKTDSNTGVGIRFSNSTDFSSASGNAIISGVRTNANGANSGALAFFTNTNGTDITEKLRINHIGNVGIGTTAPASKLDISSGTITMAGTGAPAAGYALCINAAKKLSTCSNTPAADGTCTCI